MVEVKADVAASIVVGDVLVRINEEVCLVEAVIVAHHVTDVRVATIPIESTFVVGIVGIEVYLGVIVYTIGP